MCTVSGIRGLEASMHRHRFFLFAALLVSAPSIAMDRDTAQMELAQAITAVEVAQRDDAARYAPADFDEARVMLDTARRASDGRDWLAAATYAERAKVAGDLASARSRQQRAESATAEIRRSLDTLRASLSTSRGGS
jgi:hypothetical protein